MSARTFGVNTWVWTSPLTDRTLAELAPRIADWGFDVIELPVENPGDWDPARAAKLLDSLGLAATVTLVMGPGRELVAAERETIAATRDYLRQVVDAAATVSAPVIAGPAYASVGRTWRMTEAERRACYEQLRESLDPVVEHAMGAGVTVGVEPLNRYETSVLNTVDQALEALDGLPPAGCGLALDVYHMNIEEQDIPAAIGRAAGRIAHVQVCANDRGAPGADHLDWPGIVAALDAAGYRGPLVIESFTAENATIATAASIWRPLASSQDAIAVDGLSYLSRLARGGMR
ncbi:sugar phosphate isomerase/epimerase family protein [Phytoactinopolyspora halotolerans]|uniref:Sugar phosphate isomerase/epimerase n=1 Tax=Phytoactinopolyspora halotolerans TaxID=1981512 RepID=A0A6L9SEG7_9ACTN|nr:sugar phosphate isomerase/epimerase [Phytoactinopolyspora halotolerans]NEE03497.1 sugar phosphate isomerase/epimerase [Phytoactinopolyspora halotolerans]